MHRKRTTTGHAMPYALRSVAAGITIAVAAGAVAQSATPAGSTAAAPPSNDALDVQRLIKDGQHTQALKLIDDSLAKNPKDPNMRFRRGVVLSLLDRKTEALAVFQKLVDDHPDMPAPYNNMAVLYGAQGDYEKARGALERAIRTNPAYATAYQNLGDVYAQLASQAYSKALQLDKTDASVPPKLALLRELASGPVGVGPAVASAAADKPVVVAAAAPAPVPDKVAAKPAPAPASAAMPAPAPAPTPAPAAPAPAPPPAPPPTPAAVSAASKLAAAAPAAALPANAANPVADVEAAVRAWASAWSRRDMSAYLAAYTPEYNGQQGSRKGWEDERRDRIASRKRIQVDVSQLQISVNGDRAQARFKQIYSSDSLDVTSRKTLELVRGSGGRWQIRRESVGG